MPPLGVDRPYPKVLLVDDDAISREVLGMVLEMHGFPVESAEDGAQALAALDTATKAASAEVILMDTQMPGLSGVELIRALREQTGARIVAISGSEPGEAIREAADGFLLKPIQAEDLVHLLEFDAARGELANVSAEAAVDSAKVADQITTPLIDPAVLGKLKAMMPAKAVEEIYSAVASDLTTRLAALKVAMDAADMAEVKQIAHAIKGGCGMVGLAGAGQAASRLETSNRHETWPKELSQLQLALNQLQSILGDGLPW